MLSSSRRPDTTIRIFSSAVYCLRVLRRISRTVLSAGSFLLIDFCLIFVPFGHYDETDPPLCNYLNLDLSRFDSGSATHLSGLLFEGQGAFTSQS